MLETLYNYFGFAGSLVVAFLSFLFLVFWIAGVAGITLGKRKPARQTLFILMAVLFPPYPVAWLIVDMIKQKKELKRL